MATDDDSAGVIKGAAVREFFLWLEDTRKNDLRAAVEDMPAHLATDLDASSPAFGILSSAWYSAAVVHRLLDRLFERLAKEEREALAQVGGEIVMRRTLSGPYRALFSFMATPERYARHAQRLWSSYYRTGTLVVTIDREGQATSFTRKWPAHHPILCAMNGAAARVIFEAMGAKDVKVAREHCVASGAPDCKFVVRYR